MAESQKSPALAWLALILGRSLNPPAAAGTADLTIAPLSLAPPAGLLLIAAFLVGMSCFRVFQALQAPTEPAAAEPKPAAEETPPPPTEAGTLSLLNILQREGRLIDFLRESVASYSDEQVGAAVRAIHADCRRALDEHVDIEPVLADAEGDRVVIEAGFDPSAVRLSGNLSGDPPYRGVLQHHGWRLTNTRVPERPPSQDARILAPAEVEIT